MTINDLGQNVDLPGHGFVSLDKKDTVTHGEVLNMEQEMHQQAEALQRLGLLTREVEQRAQKIRDLRIAEAYIVSALPAEMVREKLHALNLSLITINDSEQKLEVLDEQGGALVVFDFSIAGITSIYCYEPMLPTKTKTAESETKQKILAQMLPAVKRETRRSLRGQVTIVGEHEINFRQALEKVDDELTLFNLERNEKRLPNQIIYRGYNISLETGVKSTPMHERMEEIAEQLLEHITKKKKIISEKDAVVSMINKKEFRISFTGTDLQIVGQVESQENLKPGITVVVKNSENRGLFRFEISIVSALHDILQGQNFHLVDYTFTNEALRERLSGAEFSLSRVMKQLNIFTAQKDRPAIEAEKIIAQYLAYFEGFQRTMRDLLLARQRALDLQVSTTPEQSGLSVSLLIQRTELTIKNNLMLYERLRANFEALYKYLETEMLLARATALQQILQMPDESLPTPRVKK